jgi:hypothetical protein
MKKIRNLFLAFAMISSSSTAYAVIDTFPYTNDIASQADVADWTLSGCTFYSASQGIRFNNAGQYVILPRLDGDYMSVAAQVTNGTYFKMYYSLDSVVFETLTYPVVSNQEYYLPQGTQFVKIEFVYAGSYYLGGITIRNYNYDASRYKFVGDSILAHIDNEVLYLEGRGAMYDGQVSLANLGYSTFNSVVIGEGITKIGANAFSGTNISDIQLPASLDTIGDAAFYQVSGPTSLYLPNNLKHIGYQAFYNMPDLDYVRFGTGLKSVGNRAFAICAKLTSVRFEATNCRQFGDRSDAVFYQCTALKNFLFGNSVTAIPPYMFTGMSSYQQFLLCWQNGQSVDGYTEMGYVAVPPTVNYIGEGAFLNTNIEYLFVPQSVDTIGAEAFSGNTNMEAIAFEKTTPPKLAGGLVFHNINKGTCRLVVPSSAYNAYASAAQYRDFFFIVDPTYNIAALKSLAVNSEEVDDFNSAVYTYYFTVPYEVTTITLNAEAQTANSIVSGVGTFNLKVGLNVFIITVTAADGKTSKEYTIGITRKDQNIAALKNLSVNGEEIENFSSTVYAYNLSVPYEITTALISAQAQEEGSMVKDTGIFDLKVGLNVFIITVIAPDGETSQKYTLNITRKDQNTGIEAYNSEEFIRFSNPTIDGQLYLYQFDRTQNVEIYDITGKKLTTAKDIQIINLSQYAAGIYIIKNGKYTSKFIKK